MNRRYRHRQIKRLSIAFCCCLPIFLIVTGLLKGATSFLQTLVCLTVGGGLLVAVYIIGSRLDENEIALHEEYENFKKERNRRLRQGMSDKNNK